jgi:hypothetical protein
MIAACPFAKHEPAAFYRLAAWMFNETPPVTINTLFILTLAAVGGSIGVLFSRWRKRTAFLLLLATLVVIAVVAALGNYLERSRCYSEGCPRQSDIARILS